jgi:hypothetical protein
MSRLGGSIMMGAGIMIAGLSGICSVAFAIMALASSGVTLGLALQGLMVIGVFGGIPFAIGIGLFLAGRSIVRRADAAPTTAPTPSAGAAKIVANEPDPDDRSG